MKLSFFSIMQQIAPSLSLLVTNYVVNSFGVVNIATFGIASKIDALMLWFRN